MLKQSFGVGAREGVVQRAILFANAHVKRGEQGEQLEAVGDHTGTFSEQARSRRGLDTYAHQWLDDETLIQEREKKLMSYPVNFSLAYMFNMKDFDTRSWGISPNENMYILGHGSAGCIGGYKPEEVASKLLTILPQGYTGTIHLLNCYAATPRFIRLLDETMLSDDKSGAEVLEKILNENGHKGIKIVGLPGAVWVDSH